MEFDPGFIIVNVGGTAVGAVADEIRLASFSWALSGIRRTLLKVHFITCLVAVLYWLGLSFLAGFEDLLPHSILIALGSFWSGVMSPNIVRSSNMALRQVLSMVFASSPLLLLIFVIPNHPFEGLNQDYWVLGFCASITLIVPACSMTSGAHCFIFCNPQPASSRSTPRRVLPSPWYSTGLVSKRMWKEDTNWESLGSWFAAAYYGNSYLRIISGWLLTVVFPFLVSSECVRCSILLTATAEQP